MKNKYLTSNFLIETLELNEVILTSGFVSKDDNKLGEDINIKMN